MVLSCPGKSTPSIGKAGTMTTVSFAGPSLWNSQDRKYLLKVLRLPIIIGGFVRAVLKTSKTCFNGRLHNQSLHRTRAGELSTLTDLQAIGGGWGGEASGAADEQGDFIDASLADLDRNVHGLIGSERGILI